MSADLQWKILRNNSCFLIKNQGATFTTEPNNLMNKNTFKYNGLVNKKVIGLEADPDGKGVVLAVKRKRGQNKPSAVVKKVKLTKGGRATMTSVKNVVQKNFYRMDLEDAALKRASAILRSQRPASGVQKKRRSRRKGN